MDILFQPQVLMMGSVEGNKHTETKTSFENKTDIPFCTAFATFGG
jgi:hypothetical protein